MNPTRHSKDDDIAAVRQAQAELNALPTAERYAEKLADLQTFIAHLARTEHGRAELSRRTEQRGACTHLDGESDRNFYGKLRKWLDHDV